MLAYPGCPEKEVYDNERRQCSPKRCYGHHERIACGNGVVNNVAENCSVFSLIQMHLLLPSRAYVQYNIAVTEIHSWKELSKTILMV